MSDIKAPFGYIVGLFDVLGFEYRLRKFGLTEISRRYDEIVQFVNANSKKNKILHEVLNISGPLHTKGGRPAIHYEIKAAHASDTIIVWANLAWKIAQGQSLKTIEKYQNNPVYGHQFRPVPLEPFLSTCAEIVCKSIEIDLPLRGAIAMGEAVFNENDRVFLGLPIVDAARLENKQNCIGVSVCNSYLEQSDHRNFFLPYSNQFKTDFLEPRKEYALNWPLYWRTKRLNDLKSVFEELSEKNNNHQYYLNTLEFIEYSEIFDYKAYWNR
ncbi:hypothetical protein [Marinilabilia salmonicolor]|uniref:hypothetical protein n=1 Tax=Marinilabilia salmonicolor TaxID=989 RepID=UPI00029A08AC|nr:hypothetical protein [Marinilabilia salmonicolor]